MNWREFLQAVDNDYPFAAVDQMADDLRTVVESLVEVGYLEYQEQIAEESLRPLLEQMGIPMTQVHFDVTPLGRMYMLGIILDKPERN